jgi:hypothetical protein
LQSWGEVVDVARLQLLVALMQVNAGGAALLMMQWLQVGAENEHS